jgi:GT2 family glycosyltransferase
MDLSIIIVTYNNFDKVRRCLQSIYQSDLATVSFEVVVVDNASTESPDFLKSEFPAIRLIKNHLNLGMGAGNNVGARQALGEFLLVLNPDTELEPQAIKTMLRYAREHEEAGVIGPKLLYPDGERQISCYHFPSVFTPVMRRTFVGRFFKSKLNDYLMKSYDLDKIIQVDWLMGSCLLIKKSLFMSVGQFDERFFMYYEDTDLCRRISEAHKKNIYFPLATVIHHHGRASAKSHWLTSIFANKMAQIHLTSHLKYFIKWGI